MKLDWKHVATVSFMLVVPYTILFLFTASHPLMGMVLWASFLAFICAILYK